MPIFLIFIIVPILELWLLVSFASQIGWLTTLTLVIVTAVIGVQLLKQQSIATLMRANSKWQQGDVPAQELIEGLLLAFSGALLLTPGFITDAIGFVLMIRPTRAALAKTIIRFGTERFFSSITGGRGGVFVSSSIHQTRASPLEPEGDTIEGEVTATAYKDNKDSPSPTNQASIQHSYKDSPLD